MDNDELLKDLESLVGMELKSFKTAGFFDFFPEEIEVYDKRLFYFLINSLKIDTLTKFSKEKFQSTLFSYREISGKQYEITLKGTKAVSEFLDLYSPKYKIKDFQE